jgi:hypothetical protein
VRGKIGTKGRRYTVGGEPVSPKELTCRTMFRWANFILKWAKEGDKKALHQAEKVLEERYLKLGIKMGRAPHDFMWWKGDPFWGKPDVYQCLDLTQKPGGTFRLSELERKVVRKQVKLGIKHGFIFDKPWILTIKHFEPRLGDPRGSQVDANAWCGHYMAAVGRFMKRLRDEFGYLPFLNEVANEYNTANPHFTKEEIRNFCWRWQHRDVPGEIIGIHQAGPPIDPDGNFVPYKPELGHGPWSPADIQLSPHRSFHGGIKWWHIGDHIDRHFGHHPMPIYVAETIFLMTKPSYDRLPSGHSWRTIGTKLKRRYGEMVEDLWEKGYYVCIHDGGDDEGSFHGGGLDAGWVPGFGDKPGRTDEFIRELMGVSEPEPPPAPPQEPEPSFWKKLWDAIKRFFGG